MGSLELWLDVTMGYEEGGTAVLDCPCNVELDAGAAKHLQLKPDKHILFAVGVDADLTGTGSSVRALLACRKGSQPAIDRPFLLDIPLMWVHSHGPIDMTKHPLHASRVELARDLLRHVQSGKLMTVSQLRDVTHDYQHGQLGDNKDASSGSQAEGVPAGEQLGSQFSELNAHSWCRSISCSRRSGSCTSERQRGQDSCPGRRAGMMFAVFPASAEARVLCCAAEIC